MSEKHFSGKVAVKALIVKDGKVLICRDALNESRWEIPGGRINEGETLDEALKREAREELGVSIKVVRLVNSEQALHIRDQAMILFLSFEAVLDDASDIALPPQGEIAEVRWLAKGDLEEYEFYPDSLNALKRYWETP